MNATTATPQDLEAARILRHALCPEREADVPFKNLIPESIAPYLNGAHALKKLFAEREVEAIQAALDASGAATHHPNNGSPDAKPLTILGRIAWLGKSLEIAHEYCTAHARRTKKIQTEETFIAELYELEPNLKTEGLDNFDGYFVHWNKIIDHCARFGVDGYGQSPMEMLTDIGNHRDDARKTLTEQEHMYRTFVDAVKSALDAAGVATHHPDIGAPARKPMMPQERIAWLATELQTARLLTTGQAIEDIKTGGLVTLNPANGHVSKYDAQPAPNLYLIYSPSHTKGIVTWWRPDSAGYTTDIQQAGRYTREEALEIVRATDREEFALRESALAGFSIMHSLDLGIGQNRAKLDKLIQQGGLAVEVA